LEKCSTSYDICGQKKMIYLEKLNHRGRIIIGLRFVYDAEIKRKVKGLPEVKYSKTHGCWYLPYTRAAYKALKLSGLPYKIPNQSGTTDLPISSSDHTAISGVEPENLIIPKDGPEPKDISIRSDRSERVRVSWSGGGFSIKMPYDTAAVAFIKRLSGSWWSRRLRSWQLRGTLRNLEEIQKYFCCFDADQYKEIYELIRLNTEPRIIELFRTPEKPDCFMVKIKGFGADISYIKSIPGRKYNREFRRWEIPANNEMIDRVLAYYNAREYKIVNRLPVDIKTYKGIVSDAEEKLRYILSKSKPAHHPTVKKMVEGMLRMRYSWKTIALYVSQLKRIMDYYGNERDMDDLTAEEVNGYLTMCARQEVSSSFLNMAYSAVKLYNDKICHRASFELWKLQRPRKGRPLPVILSEQEVHRLLQATSNLKHTTILYTLYGGGLRLGETLQLRVDDILWDRNQICIRSGKGRKDRMVMLSQMLKDLLRHYFDIYQPRYWLFEGTGGKPYSSSSVQKIVKKAAKQAKINKKVTPHTLRHCFATHLMDRGLDCRYIQELLGHKDIKTTLIYTHVTNKTLKNIQSPLDNLKK